MNMSFSLLLGVAVLLFGHTDSAVFLKVSPNRQLFLRRDSVALSCVDNGNTVDGWTVKRTVGGQTEACHGNQQDFGIIKGSSCVIQVLVPSDSGVYWCEDGAGQRSVQVDISVSEQSVILELPKLPVIRGSDVTLHCKTAHDSTQTTYFFMNGSFIGTGHGDFTIKDVQQSHEGLYSCSTGLLSTSSKTWLSVRDPPPLSLFSVRLLCHLVVICPYCICTILLVSVYCSKRRGNAPAVSVHMDPRFGGGHGLAEEYDETVAAVVTIKHSF